MELNFKQHILSIWDITDRKKLLSLWDENTKAERQARIKEAIDDSLLFFFKKDKEIYGCPEESRLTFARIKFPDEEASRVWGREASFLGYNLTRGLLEDNIPERVFYKADLKDIKIIDKDDAEKELLS